MKSFADPGTGSYRESRIIFKIFCLRGNRLRIFTNERLKEEYNYKILSTTGERLCCDELRFRVINVGILFVKSK